MQVFEKNMEWADKIARAVHRKLPPSFDLQDLEQEARIKLWECAQRFNAETGVPFQAFAYMAVRGAVLMSIRRRAYVNATAEELMDTHLDPLGDIESRLKAEYARQAEDRKRQRRRKELIDELIPQLTSIDGYLVRRHYLDGISLEQLSGTWSVELEGLTKRVVRAVRALKRAKRAGA